MRQAAYCHSWRVAGGKAATRYSRLKQQRRRHSRHKICMTKASQPRLYDSNRAGIIPCFQIAFLLFGFSTGVPVSDNILTYHQPTYLPSTYLIWNKALFENNYYCIRSTQIYTMKKPKRNVQCLQSLFGKTLTHIGDNLKTSWKPLDYHCWTSLGPVENRAGITW